MTRPRSWRLAVVLSVLAVVLAACGNAPDDGPGVDGAAGNGGGASGTIEIDGSSTVAPLTDAIAEEYAQAQPDVTVNLAISGTGGGFERFCGTGDTDISNASRPIKEEEAARCEENGTEYVEVRVGTDALTMVVNPENDFVDCLTTEEVTKIFGPDSPASSWNEVRSDFPDEDLEVFAPDTDSGTYDFMVEDVLGIEGSRQDYNAAANDNVISQGVAGTVGSWGFFGFAYFQQSQDQLKPLAYDAGEGCVDPSVETVQDDSYKMARPLFIYVKTASLQEKDHVADFVQFYLDNVGSVIEDVGYIPAPEDVIEQSRNDVEEALSG